jgi:hypothetical protein
MKIIIDTPSPFASADELKKFLEEMFELRAEFPNSPEVAAAIKEAEEYLQDK